MLARCLVDIRQIPAAPLTIPLATSICGENPSAAVSMNPFVAQAKPRQVPLEAVRGVAGAAYFDQGPESSGAAGAE